MYRLAIGSTVYTKMSERVGPAVVPIRSFAAEQHRKQTWPTCFVKSCVDPAVNRHPKGNLHVYKGYL